MPRITNDHPSMEETPVSSALRTLRENLTTVMASLSKTEPAFAKIAKIDQKTMWRVMHGGNEPTLDTVSKLAKACGIEPWQLLTPGLEPNNPPMLAAQTDRLRTVLDNIRTTKESIEDVLRDQGKTRSDDT
jgi:predicted transcriptional regulator